MIDIQIMCDGDEKEDLGNRLHNALKGNKAYINNDIILNVDLEDRVLLTLGENNDNDIELDVLDFLTCS